MCESYYNVKVLVLPFYEIKFIIKTKTIGLYIKSRDLKSLIKIYKIILDKAHSKKWLVKHFNTRKIHEG